MKNVKRIILSVMVIVSVCGAFYTENLTEKKKKEMMTQNNPEQCVSVLMKDSIAALENRAITLGELAKGISTNHQEFAKKHGKTLGIGSPVFYVVHGRCDNPQLIQEEKLQGISEGVPFSIPLKYIFGNTARDASGWYNIDDFQNTMDFNDISAAMNKLITNRLKEFQWQPSQP